MAEDSAKKKLAGTWRVLAALVATGSSAFVLWLTFLGSAYQETYRQFLTYMFGMILALGIPSELSVQEPDRPKILIVTVASCFAVIAAFFLPELQQVVLSYILGDAAVIGFTIFLLYMASQISAPSTTLAKASVNFEAAILDKKKSYRQGENIQLWAKYIGKLDKGYHVIQVSSVSGATIPKGRDWWSDSTTYHNPNGSGRVGRLIVPPPYEYKASQPLTGFPIGEYKIVFEIGQGRLGEGKRLARAEAFFVVESSEIEVRTGGSEQTDLRKREIWNAFQKWTQLPIVRFRDQQDTLPLAEKPPELAFEIDECLKSNYPAIWDGVLKLRQQYHAWKNEDVPHRFTKVENGRTIIDLRYVHAYNESMCNKLVALHRQLAEQIRSEILDKHHSRLKC